MAAFEVLIDYSAKLLKILFTGLSLKLNPGLT
jgi:hypothetical protein